MPGRETSTDRTVLDAGGADFWRRAAATVADWASRRGIPQRDLIVLLPNVEGLAPARLAWAMRGGWVPRIETTQTLAAALGPAAPASAGALRFDAALDRLGAAALLRSQPWGRTWARQHPQAFDVAAARVAQTAAALARAAFTQPPQQRVAWWQRARERLGPLDGPGATERMLARVALEWAALAPPPSTDALFDLAAAGWIVVQAHMADALAEGLLAVSQAPALVLEARSAWIEAQDREHEPQVQLAHCSGFEDEAQSAAAQVLSHLAGGQQPVVLVAQDREAVRRARALLERHQVRMIDETGWRLSTTRAAARVMSLLRACRPWASTDDVLDALKAAQPVRQAGDAVERIESLARRRGWTRRERIVPAELTSAALALWQAAEHTLDALWAGGRAQPLGRWLNGLHEAIVSSRAWGDGVDAAEAGDAAMLQLWAALRLDDLDTALPEEALAFDAFVDWVDATLEQATFVAVADAAQAQVVITPLERAVLRPFAAAVVPGCDEKRFGASFEADPLLGDALAADLGLPSVAARRSARRRALELLLAVPQVTLLHRRADGEEPLAPSPWVEWLDLLWRQRGHGALPAWTDPRVSRSFTAAPVLQTAPAALRLPQRLSASTVAALRECPYRFFSRAVLGLREAEELEDDPSKSDYGNWLHAVLYRFHVERTAPRDRAQDRAALAAIAIDERARHGLDDRGFLPYSVSFDRFAEHYVEWLAARDAQGWRWHGGEVELAATWPSLDGVELFGRLDRIDQRGDGQAWQLIDYKTGSASDLKKLARDRLEDTQLAFYAAVARAAGPPGTQAPLEAGYLAVDDPDGLHEITHAAVDDSAQRLVEGLSDDLRRLRQGAGLAALGEGRICEYCEARGLCRRDDWPSASAHAQDNAEAPAP
jgi:ATP-dependent helicase/nuclease subunit B